MGGETKLMYNFIYFFPKGLCPRDFELLWKQDGISNICAGVVISLCQFWGQAEASRLVLNALSPLFPIAARRKLVGKNIYFFNSIIFK